uniref:Uncharacterized protein n=1 Tax=Anguilla anguilla TaxID=7936 RepID=A0A0E9UXJ0_ANGAN
MFYFLNEHGYKAVAMDTAVCIF